MERERARERDQDSERVREKVRVTEKTRERDRERARAREVYERGGTRHNGQDSSDNQMRHSTYARPCLPQRCSIVCVCVCVCVCIQTKHAQTAFVHSHTQTVCRGECLCEITHHHRCRPHHLSVTPKRPPHILVAEGLTYQYLKAPYTSS